MEVTRYLPVGSSLVIGIFALLVFRRYARRGGTHLLLWGIGLLMFGVASFAEAYSTFAWSPTVFRLWYLAGAVLVAAWLGQGTVYLLSGQRLANVLAAAALGYATAAVLFFGLSRTGLLTVRTAILLISFHGIIFGWAWYRRAVRRWHASRVTGTLTALLIAGSLVAAYLVFTVPLDAGRFNPAETLSAQYRESVGPGGERVPGILPPGAAIRRITPFFNIYGVMTLVGGALYSAWLLWRKEIVPQRVVGNILIAAGALALGLASTLVRLGLSDYLYVGEFIAAVSMFGGFLLATTRPAASP
ncbi:MAG: hypothetical protein ACRDFT_01670, partial [bacterium]